MDHFRIQLSFERRGPRRIHPSNLRRLEAFDQSRNQNCRVRPRLQPPLSSRSFAQSLKQPSKGRLRAINQPRSSVGPDTSSPKESIPGCFSRQYTSLIPYHFVSRLPHLSTHLKLRPIFDLFPDRYSTPDTTTLNPFHRNNSCCLSTSDGRSR